MSVEGLLMHWLQLESARHIHPRRICFLSRQSLLVMYFQLLSKLRTDLNKKNN